MRSTSRFTRVPALIGAAALVSAALAGCTALPGLGGCDPKFTPGDSSSIVTATGTIGTAPTVDFPTPLVSTTPQVSVVEAGDGALIDDGAQADFTLAVYLGNDGSKLSGDTAVSARLEVGIEGSALSEALACSHVGDRLAITAQVKDALGAGAGANLNLADDDTLVYVVDMTAAYLGKADGFNQLPQDGMPVVVTAVDGTPAIAVSLLTKPTVTRIETVKGGDGATIGKDDKAVVQLRAWTWPDAGDDPAEITAASTWAKHTAVTVGDPAVTLPQGVLRAITGAKVGSQLLIVIPPGDDGYATIPSDVTITADQTMIWVVDILGIQKS